MLIPLLRRFDLADKASSIHPIQAIRQKVPVRCYPE
jgi:hypothetical protein